MIKKSLILLILISSLRADDITLSNQQIFTLATDEVSIGKNHQKKEVGNTKSWEDLKTSQKNVKNDTPSNPVVYLKGKPRSEKTRHTVTSSVRAIAAANTDLSALAKKLGATSIKRQKGSLWIVIKFEDGFQTLEKMELIRKTPGITKADPLLAKKRSKKLIPNDTLFSDQWHLNNTGQNGGSAGIDANITSTWDSYLGTGVTISIVDDGLENSHSDLAANARTDIDHNWNDGDENDASPTSNNDTHGTSCAGVAAARGNNGTGVSGAAPNAELVGLRLIAGGVSDLDEAEAIDWRNDIIDISSNSWGPADDGAEFYEPGPLFIAAVKNGVQNGRAGKGVIYTWAGGNGGSDDNSNQDGYANMNETISVGAITNGGVKSSYSEQGANVIISAPSNGGSLGITTVAINNGYRSDFGGTSSATPLVSGVCALMLEANPNLGWRDIQEILMSSATQIDSTDPDWTVNTAGFQFNHKYGAGMVNAAAAVTLAGTWVNLDTQNTRVKELSNINRNIADNSTETFAIDLSDQDNLRVEHARLHVEATHPQPGNLEITLTSPDGTPSILTVSKNMSQANIDFSFLTVRSWGEDSQGVWTVTIRDAIRRNSGSIQTLRLELYGTNADPPAPQPPTITSSKYISSSPGEPIVYQIVATREPTSYSTTVLPVGLTIDGSTGVISGTVNDSGYYIFTVSATNSIGTTSEEITLLTAPSGTAGIPLAADIPSQTFTHSGNTDWTWITADIPTSDHSFILKSGLITHDQSSTLQMNITGPGNLYFDWAVSSEAGYDFLTVSLGGNELDAISGNLNFQRQSISIPAGEQTITWSYTKDFSVSQNDDAAYLDRIRYAQDHSYEAFIDNYMAGQEYTPDAQPLADPDNDGVNNLTEFLISSDPLTATTDSKIAATHSPTETTLSLTTDPRLVGITHTFESSSDLMEWDPVTSSTTSETATTIIKEASIIHSPTNPQKFLRLKIEQ